MVKHDSPSSRKSSNNADIERIKEVEESLLDSALSEEESEQLGAELPDLPYDDEPVNLDYDNEPVVERKGSGRWGIVVVIVVLAAALLFFDEIKRSVTQLF
ncbi:hypothetical protein [Kangiella marina]|uniref:Uncharacterized protein n=1 Tax=Kangiella marina TaxID=1079178 RepID=A0ABP8IMQ4_9GAMM